jgi:flagella basal body P-ring formation protein FlgA
LVRRSISADAVIPLDALDRPPTIKRGEVVTVLAAMPGIEIRSSGVALADARSGETVRIRHATSLKVIQARADTPGVVRVDR